MQTENKTCCVFGHRKIEEKEEIRQRLTQIIENLIVNENVDTFLVGSRSEFDDLCRKVLCQQKEKYPHIKRIYVRGEFTVVGGSFEEYLLKECDSTYFPERAKNAGRVVYVERNYEMIDKSDICIVYYKEGVLPPRRKYSKINLFDYQPKSGTQIAYQYAVQKKRKIINLANE